MKRILSLFAFLCLVFMLILSCETGNEPTSTSQPEQRPRGEIISLFANHVFLVDYKIEPEDFSIVYYDDEKNYHQVPWLPSSGIVLEIGKDENNLRSVTLGTTKYQEGDKIFRARITDENHPAEICEIECSTLVDLATNNRLTLSLPFINIYQNTPESDYPKLFHGGLKADKALMAYTESFIDSTGKVLDKATITFEKKDDPNYPKVVLGDGDAKTVLDAMKVEALKAYNSDTPIKDSLTFTYTVEYTISEGKTITSGPRNLYVSGKDKNY